MGLILASASPRRRELLALITPDFEVIPSEADESLPDGLSGRQAVAVLAERKARGVAKLHSGDIVIGCDTTVVVGNVMLGKPKDVNDAKRMLHMLSGKKHEVYTGICITGPDKSARFMDNAVAVASVWFDKLSEDEITQYCLSGEPYDKAGAYAIQGWASKYINRIDGDVFAVIGLPVNTLYKMMKNRGII